MERPNVQRRDWIMVKTAPDSEAVECQVYNIHDDGTLFVGYFQHSFKTTKLRVDWNGEFWQVVVKP
ncbi:hypothetical protein [Porticoccus sp.]